MDHPTINLSLLRSQSPSMAAAAAIDHEPSSSTTSPCGRYDVHLSFRYQDTGKNFTDYLYTALKQAGFHTIKAAAADEDHDADRSREDIQKAAIEASKISIVVFSKDYAASTYCLDELVLIMKQKKAAGHIVLPVFYNVDPSQVSDQTKNYAEAFANHEIVFEKEMERVNEWRVSLAEVASLGGMVLQDGYEAQFVQDIVKEVSNKLNRDILHVPFHFVGGDFLVKDVNLWLHSGLDDVRFALLHGLGGVGKTTIAKLVYNQNFVKFEARSFLANIRERLEQPNGLMLLQEQLLSDILNKNVDRIQYANAGFTMMEDVLCTRKVLVVLDNVEKEDQFINEIVRMRNLLSPGSRIIITTRNESLLPAHEVCAKIKVEPLDDFRSLQLFSWHAFGQAEPKEEYVEYSKRLVQHCSGLPLALTVIGSSLSGKKTRVWESALLEMESIPNPAIQKVLRISYDSLNNDHHKNLFLDIACFFIGMDEDHVLKILSGLGINATFGLQNLSDGCLIEIDENRRLLMHPLIRDMGRQIARQDLPKCGRIWRDREAFTLLRQNNGTKTVHGLTLNMQVLLQDSYGGGSFHCIDAKAFSKMYNLRYLKINYARLAGNYEHFPKGLLWLSWHGFHLKSFPKHFCLEKLVVLEMQNSNLVDAWTEKMVLPKLKILDLSNSRRLVRTPNFSGIPALERLILEDCVRLVKIDESIGDLKQLVFVSLKNCINLKELPDKIEMLDSLEHLVLHGCSNLEGLRKDSGQKSQWRLFHRDGLVAAESYIMSMPWIRLVCSCFSPRQSSELTTFSLPRFLVALNLSRTQIHCLPESIKSLNTLACLRLNNCESLTSLPELPTRLQVLGVSGCLLLHKVANLPPFLFLYHCRYLDEVQDLIKQEFIRMDDLNMLRIMKMIGLQIKPAIFEIVIESGVFSVYLPGLEFPSLSEDECKLLSQGEQAELTFNMPSSAPCNRICGLNVWTVCSISPESMDSVAPYARIKNQTKGSRMVCSPFSNFFLCSPGFLSAFMKKKSTEMLWFSHWVFGDHKFDSGDEVNVYVNPRPNIQIKKIGVQLVHENEEEEPEEEKDSEAISEETASEEQEEENCPSSLASWVFDTYQCCVRTSSVNRYYRCLFMDKEISRNCFRRFLEQKRRKHGS